MERDTLRREDLTLVDLLFLRFLPLKSTGKNVLVQIHNDHCQLDLKFSELQCPLKNRNYVVGADVRLSNDQSRNYRPGSLFSSRFQT